MFQKLVVEHLNITLTEKQLAQFEAYFTFLVEYNEHVNLTAITAREDVYLKHFLDSIMVLKYVDLENEHICDVGAGAGFPCIPLKIVKPNLRVTVIEALEKRVTFLKQLVKRLELEGVEAIHARAEEYAKEKRGTFDVAFTRAVAKQAIVNELCLPLLKVGGSFISLKGRNYQEELNQTTSFERLNARVHHIYTYQLPVLGEERAMIVAKVIKEIPTKYPRHYAQIIKKPL